ncbi:MAG TPA: ricin-type beta-trefoil lectin domain protein [Steroidobacteraceae bacterium]
MIAKSICAIFSVLFVLTSLTSCSTTAQVTSGNSNQCINVVNHGYPVAGTPLRLKPCDPWQNQQWSIRNGQMTGVGGFCVDVQGSAAVDGAPLIYAPCNGSPGQMWTAVNGTIVGIGGKCIDIGSDAQALPPLVIAACTGSASQVWVLH